MLFGNNKYNVLAVFFESPSRKEGFKLREISRKIKLAPKSVSAYLRELVKEGFIRVEKSGARKDPVYFPNRDSEKFRLYKTLDTVSSISDSGLLDFLEDKLMPDAIVLFGSASRGEDTEDSDIDLFLLCKEADINVSKFASRAKRKISLHFGESLKAMSPELANNVLNGIVLRGYVKAV